MKVILDLPDWVDERNLRLTAGVELVALKAHNDSFWKIKDARCNACGDCCTGLKNHVYPLVEGECIHLQAPDVVGKRMCGLALYRSRICDNDPREGQHKRCSITYKIKAQK